jgi:hypothetical protein
MFVFALLPNSTKLRQSAALQMQNSTKFRIEHKCSPSSAVYSNSPPPNTLASSLPETFTLPSAYFKYKDKLAQTGNFQCCKPLHSLTNSLHLTTHACVSSHYYYYYYYY